MEILYLIGIVDIHILAFLILYKIDKIDIEIKKQKKETEMFLAKIEFKKWTEKAINPNILRDEFIIPYSTNKTITK